MPREPAPPHTRITTRADAPCAVLQLKCNAEGTELTAGLKCSDIGGPAGCGGMLAGTAGSGHNRYLCNRITLAVRHYLARYYNSPYQCEECGAETKVRIRPTEPATPSAHTCSLPAVGRVGGLALRRVRPGGDAMRDARVPGLHGQTGARPPSAAPARVVLTGRPMQFSSHDLYTQLSYYRYLFDHDRQRENLQRKRAPLPRRRRCRSP